MKYFSRLLLISSVFFLLSSEINAQPGCPGVSLGPDINLGCNIPCTTLTANTVQTGTTSSYTVSSIPYTPPYAFNTGTPILVNVDDLWSSAIALPFSFCYYGNTYNQIVVGSNGVITFDMSQAGGYCQWPLSDPCPSPNNPLNSIYGVFHDIDPAVGGSMYYAILGTYPCRTFLVNWYQIPMFSSSCNYMLATHQIVLYESTNIIEVYIQNKPLCSSWNDGNGLVGIQDAAGTTGLAAPGRNTGQWTASNEAWRFTPSGPSAINVVWFENGVQVAAGVNTYNACPTQSSVYIAEATYTTCVGTQVVVYDTVNVQPGSGSVQINPQNPALCQGQSVTLTATGSTGTYTWSPATGLSGTTGASVNASPATTTTYTVTGTSPNCTATNTVTVTVNPPPTITITPPGASLCMGDSVVLTASGALSYVWAPSTSLSADTGAVVLCTPTSAVTYTITGTDANSCTNSTNITVSPAAGPVLSINANPMILCPGDIATITASGALAYSWSPPNGLSATTGSTVTAAPFSTTTYTIIGDNNGCLGSADITITVNTYPNIDFIADVYEGCVPLLVTFTDLTTPAVQSWHWDFHDPYTQNTFSGVQNPQHYFTEGGLYDISLFVVTVDGCEMGMTYPQMINAFPKPIAAFTSLPQVVSILEPHVWFFDESIGADYLNWDFGDETSNDNYSTDRFPQHDYSDTGAFVVMLAVSNEQGCVDTTRHTILVEPNISFYIPNAFTPNKDALNETFLTKGEGIDLSTYSIRIFDRWGQQVFQSGDMFTGWDGKNINTGKLCEMGVYSYIISFRDIKQRFYKYTGSLTLVL